MLRLEQDSGGEGLQAAASDLHAMRTRYGLPAQLSRVAALSGVARVRVLDSSGRVVRSEGRGEGGESVVEGRADLGPDALAVLDQWDALRERYSADELVTHVRDKEIRQPLFTTSLS